MYQYWIEGSEFDGFITKVYICSDYVISEDDIDYISQSFNISQTMMVKGSNKHKLIIEFNDILKAFKFIKDFC